MNPEIPALSEFLQALPDLSLKPQVETWQPGVLGLAAMEQLMEELGQPQQRYPAIHVAGSNGKGSTSALLAAALAVQGYRVGLYTSPHLSGQLAGIRLDGQPVPLSDLEATWQALYPHVAKLPDLTLFEVVTALAFQHFARARVDAAVIEVGLGGRLDATNVLTPAVSVITPIDLEHTRVLGDSLAAIAAEKAGIIKPGVHVVMARQAEEAAAVIRAAAAEQGAPLTEIGRHVLYERVAWDRQGQDVHLWAAEQPDEPPDLHLGLLGAYQAANAASAFAALKVFSLPVTDAAIQAGFAAARWPGRLHLIEGKPPILLDAAHTPAAARALAAALDDHFPGQRWLAVIGVSADKDLAGLLAQLRGRLEAVWASQSRHPRAMPAEDLTRALANAGLPATAQPDLAQALQAGMQEAEGQAAGLLVFGSVFLVEEVLNILG
jgi:dihydrofolate synthase/folylpolyglutamate synthase